MTYLTCFTFPFFIAHNALTISSKVGAVDITWVICFNLTSGGYMLLLLRVVLVTLRTDENCSNHFSFFFVGVSYQLFFLISHRSMRVCIYFCLVFQVFHSCGDQHLLQQFQFHELWSQCTLACMYALASFYDCSFGAVPLFFYRNVWMDLGCLGCESVYEARSDSKADQLINIHPLLQMRTPAISRQ